MTAIGFYHLTRTPADQALPALLGRTLSASKRAVVRLRDAARVEALDVALWRAPEPIWLPHGTGRDGDPALQPIWLTDEQDVPNGATYLFLLDGIEEADPARFERVFDLFDGTDEAAVAAARRRWAAAKAAGHELAYWRQEPQGWVRAG